SHRESVPSIDHISQRILRTTFALDDPGHLAGRIVEFVGERYLPILDDLDRQILDLEDEAVEGDPSVLPDIHALRRDVALLRRVLSPQRRVLDTLARNGAALSDRARRDLADAVERLLESPPLAERLAAAAREALDRFGVDVAAEAVEGVYRDALAARSG
ncbi:MAG: hypothetical protein KY397_03080, partial [Gemmatimonadetes bacterium]|nr:hypothetical protein [Gemmatimonadota bacterium]